MSTAHLAPHQFKPGNNANPLGRPKGSRAKLSEAFFADLHADYLEHGITTIERVRKESPSRYLMIIAACMPKQTQKVESPFTDLTNAELEQLSVLLAGLRAKTVKTLNRADRERAFQRPPERISD